MTPESLIAPARLARRPVLATQTDSRLVALVRAGYEPAFETIVSRYRAALLRYAERFLSRERAEDAVQQSFVSAYEAMLRDDAALNLRPWLYRIAHNASLNALRDRGLRHDQLDEGIDGVERPDQALERTQGLREALTAVQALPDRQREAIVLRELGGRSYEEIASELGVTEGSVRQLLNRARNTLRAGATAVVPVGLLLRLPWVASSEPIAARVAELGAGAGAGVVMAKLCATALVTGAVVGGVAVAPDGGKEERSGGPGSAAASESPD
jgi:RNA polymerase sigma factor (sigma-70 family)